MAHRRHFATKRNCCKWRSPHLALNSPERRATPDLLILVLLCPVYFLSADADLYDETDSSGRLYVTFLNFADLNKVSTGEINYRSRLNELKLWKAKAMFDFCNSTDIHWRQLYLSSRSKSSELQRTYLTLNLNIYLKIRHITELSHVEYRWGFPNVR
jgi:hypothetical protein